MPNEKINDYVSQGWYTEVSWRRKPGLDADDQGTAPGHVQLATVNVHSPFEFPEREHGDSWEAGERFDGWRVTLDEAGIDRLIKALHKAKRQAFGSPEYATGGIVRGPASPGDDSVPALLSEGGCTLQINVNPDVDPQMVAKLVEDAQALAKRRA